MFDSRAPSPPNPDNVVNYTISQLGNEISVTPRTLRRYEDQGIVSPEHVGQRRLYSRRDRGRRRLALQGSRVGLALAEIRDMVDLDDLGNGQERQMRISLEKFRNRVAELKTQRREIDAVIAELQKTSAIVEAVLKTRTGTPKDRRTGEPA